MLKLIHIKYFNYNKSYNAKSLLFLVLVGCVCVFIETGPYVP